MKALLGVFILLQVLTFIHAGTGSAFCPNFFDCSTTIIDGCTYKITSVGASPLVLDSYRITENGITYGDLVTHTSNDGDNQRFLLIAVGSLWYQIRVKDSNKCLTVTGQLGKNVANIREEICQSYSESQLFAFLAIDGANNFLIKSKSGLVLEASDAVNKFIYLGTLSISCNSQIFHLDKIECPSTGTCSCLPGDKGPDGVPGEDGKDGTDGKDGVDGKDGADGKDGNDGQPGAPGNQGPDGIQGPPGNPGKDGDPGAPGNQGPPGETGPDGNEGPVGPPGPPGNGISVYGYFYNEDVTEVQGNANVIFSSEGPRVGVFKDATGKITVTEDGIYLIQFEVVANQQNAFGLYRNGNTAVLGSIYESEAGNQQNNGRVLVALNKDDYIQLRNAKPDVPSDNVNFSKHLGIDVSLVIMKIANLPS